MRIIFILILILCNTLSIYSENETVENSSHYSLLIKRQDYRFNSYEYNSASDDLNRKQITQSNKLNQNNKILVPMSFYYDNFQRKFRLELAYFEVENANSNAFINTYKQGQLTTSRNYFPAIGRSEFEANIFKVFQMYDRFELALGGGIRNINKYIYGKNNLNGAYQEYYFTYGPQISFQSSWNFYKTFYLQLHGDLFYTRGTRFSDNLVIRPDLIRKSINNSSWNLIYRGYEIDFSLKHKINDELSIYLGYNFIESFYSPYKNNSLNLDWSLNDQNISSIEINQNLLKGNFETLKGVYLAFKINL